MYSTRNVHDVELLRTLFYKVFITNTLCTVFAYIKYFFETSSDIELH